MRTIATLCLCILLTACGSSRIAPLEIAPVRLAIDQALLSINTGIMTEDEVLASHLVHDLFKMDSNIALRYSDKPFGGASGSGPFKVFFKSAFEVHANIYHSIVLTDLELTGDIAAASVETVFNTTRADKVPPEGFAAEGTDLLIFQREAGTWLLIAWDEAPEPLPDDEEPDSEEEPIEDGEPDEPEEPEEEG